MKKNKPHSYCPLCLNVDNFSFCNDFYHCSNCAGYFRPSELLPSREEERERYESHNNDVNDPRFRKFVEPITSSILQNYTPNSKGLDFGAGTGPVIETILKENSFDVALYDPLFHNYPDVLDEQYDYIACCEVIEHFHNPGFEFDKFSKMLNPQGTLYIMTQLYDSSIDFGSWYYIRDNTHVFIYQKDTMRWIRDKYKYSSMSIEGRMITMRKA
ncbi:MAG: methyltransferase [Ignavibacteriae bacterium HGW-Ignavibacteriae-1]|nr:MAG: methyltransferase [Ignavibacteriae bacterium HGW-Ignavibacteriae-1]